MVDKTNLGIVKLELPGWAWELILETLTMDAQSSAFDRALRADIRKALHVITVTHEN